MYAFKFTAKDSQDRIVTDRVEASSIEAAYDKLEKQAYRDIRVIDSQKTAVNLDNVNSRLRLRTSAYHELQLQKKSSLVVTLAMLYANNAGIWGPILVWWVIATAILGGQSVGALIPALLFVIHLLWFIWAITPTVLYHRALDARTMLRWKEVERTMHFMARWKSWFKTPISNHEIIFRLASAEAGQGRLDAALARLEPLKGDHTLEPGLYERKLASVYFVTGQFQQVAIAQQAAYKLKPNLANTVDLATTLVRRLDNTEGAALLMEEIEGAKQSDLQRVFVLYCQGLIRLKNNEAKEALDLLTLSLELSKDFGSPTMKSIVVEIQVHLALALCACQRHQDAAPLFSAARPFIEIWKDTDLLRLCDQAQAGGGMK
ncbi:hypothetical protein ACO0LL_25610 [Undibacterium sp. TC4M20W]|uniref:hypothetical protein n=1 Tax=Undibacterium sp. TC4M20W TaxID=3413052 RepID=UPI003BF12C74